jgi:hypothetical protein
VDIDHHLVERVRVQRHDLSPTAEPAECLVDVAGRHGADPTQVLGEEETRRESTGYRARLYG